MDIPDSLPPGQYVIYALVDPTDEKVYYVGQTCNPKRRLTPHLTAWHHNGKKGDWLRHLRQQGQQPLMQILETVIGEKVALEKEREWIHHFRAQKMPLLNFRPRQTHPAQPSTPFPQKDIFEAIRHAFSHLKQENPPHPSDVSPHGKDKIRQGLLLITEGLKELEAEEREIQQRTAQYQQLHTQQTARASDRNTKVSDVTEPKAGEAKANSLKVVTHSHILAIRVRDERCIPIAQTLARLAEHFHVDDEYALPESALPAVFEWFRTLLED